jgi:hypothetical protein
MFNVGEYVFRLRTQNEVDTLLMETELEIFGSKRAE